MKKFFSTNGPGTQDPKKTRLTLTTKLSLILTRSSLDRIKNEIVKAHIPDDLANDILQYYDYIYMNNHHGKNHGKRKKDVISISSKYIKTSRYINIIKKKKTEFCFSN